MKTLILLTIISVTLSGSLRGQNIDTLSPKTNFFLKLHENRERVIKKNDSLKQQRKLARISTHKKQNTTKFNIVKTQPLLYLTGVFNVSYERKLSNKISIESRLDYINKARLPTSENETEPFNIFSKYNHEVVPVRGMAISIGPKIFLNKYEALSGFYINPQFMWKYYKSDKYIFHRNYGFDEVQMDINYIGIKIIWGRQLIIAKFMTLDLFLGLGARFRYINATISYSKIYESLGDDMCDKENFTEDFSIRNWKETMVYPTIHAGIKLGIVF